jgi:hypothetical protein
VCERDREIEREREREREREERETHPVLAVGGERPPFTNRRQG